jgi:hypothetical protein
MIVRFEYGRIVELWAQSSPPPFGEVDRASLQPVLADSGDTRSR